MKLQKKSTATTFLSKTIIDRNLIQFDFMYDKTTQQNTQQMCIFLQHVQVLFATGVLKIEFNAKSNSWPSMDNGEKKFTEMVKCKNLQHYTDPLFFLSG